MITLRLKHAIAEQPNKIDSAISFNSIDGKLFFLLSQLYNKLYFLAKPENSTIDLPHTEKRKEKYVQQCNFEEKF